MNPKIIQTEISIANYEARLKELGESLANCTYKFHALGVAMIKADIALVQQLLKDEMELLDLLTDKNDV